MKEKQIKESEFRKLKKAIALLPEPSFTNPEKAQPVKEVAVPTVVPATIKTSSNSPIFSENKIEKIQDTPLILDTNLKKIESVAKTRKPKVKSIVGRVLSYMKKYWHLLVLSILFSVINSAFEILIPFLIGRGIDFIVGANQVNFDILLKY